MLALALVVGLFVLAVVAYTLWDTMRLQTPSGGPSIRGEARNGTALLIIDMQTDFTREVGSRKWEADYLQSRLNYTNELAVFAKEQGWPVISVRHVYRGWYTNQIIRLIGRGLGAQGSDGLAMDPRITAKPDLDLEKSKSDAFWEPALSEFLKEHRIDHLILCGLDGNACVKNTAIGALDRGYRVELCDPAILASNQNAWKLQKEALQEMGAAVSQDILTDDERPQMADNTV